jgi:hypothetical protein
MADKFVLGANCKAYQNTGSFGSPVWGECTQIVNVKTPIKNETPEGSRRASGGYRQYMVTMTDFSLTFNMVWNTGETVFAAILAATYNKTEIDMIFLDGANTSGAHQGPRISAAFADFDRTEDLAGIAMADVTAKPGMTFVPVWFTGTA